MASNIDIAHRFYRAMHAIDVPGLLDTLAPDLVGHVSEGMPGGYGGAHYGSTAMLHDVWVPVFQSFRALPYPEQFLAVAEDQAVVIGEYRGLVPSTDNGFAAAFAHVMRFRDDRITELQQITDTRCWPDGEAAEPPG